MKKTALSIVLFLFHSLANAGGGQEGNGGFAFSKSAGASSLRFFSHELYQRLGWLDETCVNDRLRNANLKPIELEKLRNIIVSVRRNYLSSAIGKNPDGEPEPLLFAYGVDDKGPYIEAQQIFFISFLVPPSVEQSGMVRWIIVKALLHEASHHFDYNDDEAAEFAEKVGRISDSTSQCKK